MFKRQGIAASEAEIKNLEKTAKQAGLTLKDAGKSGADFGAKMQQGLSPLKFATSTLEQFRGLLLGTFGVSALAALATSAVVQFEKIRHATAGLGFELQRLGFAGVTPQIDAYLKRLSLTTGVARDELIPVLRESVRVLHDQEQGLAAAGLAAHLAALGYGTAGSNARALAQAMKGDIGAAAELLGVDFEELKKRIGGTQQGATLLAAELAKTAQQKPDLGLWDKFKRLLEPAATVHLRFQQEAKAAIEREIEALRVVADMNRSLAAQAQAAVVEAQKRGAAARAQTLQNLAAFDARVEQLELSAQEQLTSKRIAAERTFTQRKFDLSVELLEQQRRRALDNEDLTAQGRASINAAFDVERRALEQSFDDFQVELLRRKSEREAAEHEQELERIRQKQEADLAAAQALLESKLALTEDPEARARIEEEILAIETRRQLRTANTEQQILAIVAAAANKRVAIQKKANDAIKEDDRKAAEQRIAIAQQLSQAAFAIGNALFGENKALAIAEAIVNTYLGATLALKTLPPPASYVAAALTIAQGLAAVATIRSAEKGGGSKGTFDNPVNDQIAAIGGRRSAEDFVRITSEAFQRGLAGVLLNATPAQAEAAGVPGGQTNIFNAPIYGGDAGLRQLRRELERSERLDRSRRVR